MFFRDSVKPTAIVVPPLSKLLPTSYFTVYKFKSLTNLLAMIVRDCVWKITSEKASLGWSFSNIIRIAFLAREVRVVPVPMGEYYNYPSIDPDTSRAITRFKGRVLVCPSVELLRKRLMK
jgi:hypothetical protein